MSHKSKPSFASHLAAVGVGFLLTGMSSASAVANEYDVTIVNASVGQPLTTPLVVTHAADLKLFELGKPAPREIWELAEDGRTTLLERRLKQSGKVQTTTLGDSAILPGKSQTIHITAGADETKLSLVSMLGTTNDGFIGVQGLDLPTSGSTTFIPPVLSAGTEEHNEKCAFVPGPPCNNHDARKMDGAVGFIHLHQGIRGVGDLDATKYGWGASVAEITVTRVK